MWPRALSLVLLAALPFAPSPRPSENDTPNARFLPARDDESSAASTGRDLRLEHFVLTNRVDGRVEIAGFVEWRKRDTPHGQQMECDARFLREPLVAGGPRDVERVLHVECLTDKGPRCLWREIGPGTGRSVQAEWSEDGRALELNEWSDAGRKRGTLVASGGASMPLYLVELLRQGGLAAGSIQRFDPLARTLEPLEVRTVWLDASGPLASAEDVGESASTDPASNELDPNAASRRARAVRTVELVRNDGTLAGRYRFAGRDLVAFQWQEGSLFARAVGPEEYERLMSKHVPPPPSVRSVSKGTANGSEERVEHASESPRSPRD